MSPITLSVQAVLIIQMNSKVLVILRPVRTYITLRAQTDAISTDVNNLSLSGGTGINLKIAIEDFPCAPSQCSSPQTNGLQRLVLLREGQRARLKQVLPQSQGLICGLPGQFRMIVMF